MGKKLYLLFESASGYALLNVVEVEAIGGMTGEAQDSLLDLERFSRMVKLHAFQPFASAADALRNINNVSEGICDDDLKTFLELQLPNVKPGKSAKFELGVQMPSLGQSIQSAVTFPCRSDDTVRELLRGVRRHLPHFVTPLKGGMVERAQLGLGHSYSRAKVKFNVNRADNMIIQAICLLDQLDKDLNTFAMRLREWYGWHFPELVKIVNDNHVYAACVLYIGKRDSMEDEPKKSEAVAKLAALTSDEPVAEAVVVAARTSMGMDISDVDHDSVHNFTMRLKNLWDYRENLSEYLRERMNVCAPNLSALIGETVGARLISHAGSLTSLAKCPASTVQILGAEKALFRALKTKGNTPKYGLIFHSTFIGRASTKNKGRISRYLANKCAMACRIDAFSDVMTNLYGRRFNEQVEERLQVRLPSSRARARAPSGAAPRSSAIAHLAPLAAVSVRRSFPFPPTSIQPIVLRHRRTAEEEHRRHAERAEGDRGGPRRGVERDAVEEEEEEEEARSGGRRGGGVAGGEVREEEEEEGQEREEEEEEEGVDSLALSGLANINAHQNSVTHHAPGPGPGGEEEQRPPPSTRTALLPPRRSAHLPVTQARASLRRARTKGSEEDRERRRRERARAARLRAAFVAQQSTASRVSK